MKRILCWLLCLLLLVGLAGCGSEDALARAKAATAALRETGSFRADLTIHRSNPFQTHTNLTYEGTLDVEQALTDDMKLYLDLPTYHEREVTTQEPVAKGNSIFDFTVEIQERTKTIRSAGLHHHVYYRGGELFLSHDRSRIALTALPPLPALREFSLPADSFERIEIEGAVGGVSVRFALRENSALHKELNALCAAVFGEALDSVTALSGSLVLDAEGRPLSLSLEFTDPAPPDKGQNFYTLRLDNIRADTVRPVVFPADLESYLPR